LDPENVVGAGLATVVVGVGLTGFSIIFFAQLYSCILNLGTNCPQDASVRFAEAFPLMISGGYMIIVGSIVAVGGYIVSNLRTIENNEEPQDSTPEDK
jgi:hypothetical protein